MKSKKEIRTEALKLVGMITVACDKADRESVMYGTVGLYNLVTKLLDNTEQESK